MTESVLIIDDLHIQFATQRGALRAVNGISLDIMPGEIFGIVGETGCGKSITGLSVMQLLPETAAVTGRITFNGRDILSQSEEQMRRIRGREIAMIFQDPTTSLNPVFTVGQQMERVIRTQLGLSKKAAKAKTEEMLTAVGLPDVARIRKNYPHQLSGGMKQRAMIAMALSCSPKLLIADEPTTALDVTIQAQILELLKDLRDQFDIAIMFITHNLGVVAQLCDRMAVLYAGRVAETGRTETIFTEPHHPYTKGLLAAVPRPGSRGADLTAIPGSVPANPGEIAGCAFASRCAYVMERCQVERPSLIQIDAGHQSACFLDQPVEETAV
jgi:oligopeptide/dipeptide ABC transporter ATP-binding protein